MNDVGYGPWSDGMAFTVGLESSILWLDNSRFKVEVGWQTPDGSAGIGTPVTLTTDSGYFWFFNSSNVELLVKILDGRGVNGHFWVFYGAMTDVQYLITITDTVTGAVRTYQGQQGVQKSGNDVSAFAESSPPSGAVKALDPAKEGSTFQALLRALGKRASASRAVPAAGDTALYLNNNRFKVEVNWSDLAGTNGAGTAVPLTSDSGYFWFFSGSNVELMVKVLDGRGTNNHFWVFYGALTDVQYTITVTDTQTGAVKTYQGQQGVQKSGYDLNAF